MSEIIPNICSAVAFKNKEQYKEEFLLNLTAGTKGEREVFTEQEEREAFKFLHEFFEEYQKTAKESGLELSQFLKDGMGTVKSTYTTVSEEIKNSNEQKQQAARPLTNTTQNLKKFFEEHKKTSFHLKQQNFQSKYVANSFIKKLEEGKRSNSKELHQKT